MRLAKDLSGGTSELFRLLARTKHLKLKWRNVVRVPWLTVNCKHLYNYALEMAPGHASGAGFVGGYFGFTPTSGPDQTPEIKVLGSGADAMVDC